MAPCPTWTMNTQIFCNELQIVRIEKADWLTTTTCISTTVRSNAWILYFKKRMSIVFLAFLVEFSESNFVLKLKTYNFLDVCGLLYCFLLIHWFRDIRWDFLRRILPNAQVIAKCLTFAVFSEENETEKKEAAKTTDDWWKKKKERKHFRTQK